MRRNLKVKKYGAIFLLVVALVISSSNLSLGESFIDANGLLRQDNLVVDSAVQGNYKYEKTIDLTKGDRSKIPNVDFDFTMKTVSENDYMIGSKYKNKQGKDVFIIEKGLLPEGAGSMPFSTVKFRDTDTYDPELTKLLDNYGSAYSIINHIIKYNWGEMRSSENIQRVIARAPNEDEKAFFKSGRNNGWPEDTIAWRCFNPEGGQGSYEEGCQLLLEYPFDNFDYVFSFGLYSNPAITYNAYSFRRPMISHIEKGTDGLYNKISKPIITTDEYKELINKMHNLTYDPNYIKVKRYILTEEENKTGTFEVNKEEKIIDFVTSYVDAGDDTRFYIFNSIEEADEFYKEASKHRNSDNWLDWNGSYFTNMVPKASFTNIMKMPGENMPNENSSDNENNPNEPNEPNKPNKPLSPGNTNKSGKGGDNSVNNGGNISRVGNFQTDRMVNRPRTSDESMNRLYFAIFALASIGILSTRNKKNS